MSNQSLPAGTVHDKAPADLAKVLLASKVALEAWQNITPLARNEWICWVQSAKQDATRHRRIERTESELADGIKRPCCWIGCIHRTDKEVSPSVKWVLSRNAKK